MADESEGFHFAAHTIDVTVVGLLNSGADGADVVRALVHVLVSVSRFCKVKRRTVVSDLATAYCEHAAQKAIRKAQKEKANAGKLN